MRSLWLAGSSLRSNESHVETLARRIVSTPPRQLASRGLPLLYEGSEWLGASRFEPRKISKMARECSKCVFGATECKEHADGDKAQGTRDDEAARIAIA